MGNSEAFKWMKNLFRHSLCGPAVGWHQRPGRSSLRRIHGRGRGQWMAQCNQMPVCPIWYITAGLLFPIGGKKGSYAWISPNWKHKLEFLVETVASWLCVVSSVSCTGGLEWQWRVQKIPGREMAWHISQWIGVRAGSLCIEMLVMARSGAKTQATALLYITLLLWSCQAERRLSLAALTKFRMVSSKYNFIFSTSVSS